MKNKQVLLSTVYPPELVTVRAVLVQSAPLVSGLALTTVVAIATGSVHLSMLLVPVVAVAQVVFTCGVCLILALVTLALRDIQQILQYITFVLLIVTPIGYDRSMVPALLQWAMLLNPLYYFVSCYQDMIVAGTVPWGLFASLLVGSVAVFALASAVFDRAKQVFFEYA
jgi:lipopolysaccharide transport system permease protein